MIRFLLLSLTAFPSFLSSADSPARHDPSETREWMEKEKAVLELERQIIDRELEKFEKEKKEWGLKKRAENLARGLYRVEAAHLTPPARRRDALNRILSGHFGALLDAGDDGGTPGKLIILKIRANGEGEVLEVTVEKSELPDNLEKKVVTLAGKLDFSSLDKPLEPFEHRFPLVIKR